MNPSAKLWIRKRALMLLRAIVWRADDWLHRQEVALREEITASAGAHSPRGARSQGDAAEKSNTSTPVAVAPANLPPRLVVSECRQRESQRRLEAPRPETFQQWEARRSGVAVISKKSARRGMTAAQFDARFGR